MVDVKFELTANDSCPADDASIAVRQYEPRDRLLLAG